MSQFIEMFGIAEATKPLADFVEVSFPGEWGQEDKDGSGVKVIRTTNFTNNGKLDLSEVVTRDIDSAKIEKKKLFKGDIILERSGGTNDNPVGRVVYFEEDGVYLFNNFTQLLRCKEGVNSLFIFYSLFNYYQMNKNVIRSMGNKTTGIQNLKMDRYWQIPIADVSIELQKEFESIYRQADKSGFVGFKSQFIEMFGIAEATKPLADFVEVSFPGEWGQEDKDGSGVKVIRTTNFTNNGKLDLSEVVTRDIDSAKIEKKKLFKGDIILERSGGTNDNPVGRVVYFEEDGVYLFNNFTQLLRCKEGVNSLFIFYSLFNYYQMNKNVIRSMGNKTTGIQNLKMDRYWQIPIADVSTERQKEFESIFRQADKSGSVLQHMIAC